MYTVLIVVNVVQAVCSP